MNRRGFLAVLGGIGLGGPSAAVARSPVKAPRIGWLNPGSPTSHAALLEGFRRGLREHGYVEGENIHIEYRWAEGKYERLALLANELVQLGVDIIVTAGTPGVKAAQNATSTIPIVMAVTAGDPVATGFVKSLARPGGNITGLSTLVEDLTPKSLELLHEVTPRVTRIAILLNPDNPWHQTYWASCQQAARTIGLTAVRAEARAPGEFAGALETVAKLHAGAIAVHADPMYVTQRKTLVELVAGRRLPAMYSFREFCEVGGLISYGTDLRENYRRAATFVDKILKGTNPGDLPVEQPLKFDMVVNLRTARLLGVTIPPSVLIRADEVIR